MQIESISMALLPDELPSEHLRALSRDAVRRGVPLRHIVREALVEKSRAIKAAAEKVAPSREQQPA